MLAELLSKRVYLFCFAKRFTLERWKVCQSSTCRKNAEIRPSLDPENAENIYSKYFRVTCKKSDSIQPRTRPPSTSFAYVLISRFRDANKI